MNNIDYAIMRFKELQLCIDNQKDIEMTIDDSNILLGIVCNEMEKKQK